MEPTSDQFESAETFSRPVPRTFAELHRDVWEVVKRAPALFVLIPILLWFPVDVVLEIVTRDQGGDWMEELRIYNRLAQVANAFIGTLVSAVFLAALVDMGLTRRVVAGRVLREGLSLWGHLIGLFFLIGLRFLFGLVLLIIPGIYLLIRYSLAAPTAAFEGISGTRALRASAEYMKGKYLRVALGVSAAALIYAPFGLAPIFLAPPAAGALLSAVTTIPINVLGSFLTIGLALIYIDARSDVTFFAPVGTKSLDAAGLPAPRRDVGRRTVFTTVLTSLTCVVLTVFLWYWYALKPIDDGDEAWDREAYEESLEHYRRAARWDPEDAYVQYSIGWSLYALDQPAEAEGHFERAVELEPGNLGYLVDHARVLIDLGETTIARTRLESARQRGFLDGELLDALEAQLQEAESAL